jgi:predicted phage terminase large subunit-like protein
MTAEQIERYKFIKMARLATQKSLLDYTCYFFKEIQNQKFVINQHHEQVCEVLRKVLSGEIKKAMINIAPRYSKTEIAVKNFISQGLALNAASKYIHLSYSDDLALDNSEGVKSIVEHEKYRELFPEVQIKHDSRAKKKWYTTAGGGVYATSTAGQVTGFGAGKVDQEDEELTELIDEFFPAKKKSSKEDPIADDAFMVKNGFQVQFGGALIIDDPIKPEDADSETKRERINNRYDSTIKNRVNSRNTPIIIIMQRLHENDLCGYLLENEPGEWHVLSLPCIYTDDDGIEKALWPFKHTLEELRALEAQNPLVFGRQYMMNPMPAGGYLYSREWKTYQSIDTIPYSKTQIRKSYTDTADLGTDYLCSVAYIETELAMYVTDVLYTQAAMETTEPQTARQLYEQRTEFARFESNNGGRGFARNVETQTRLAGNKDTVIEWFHQSNNKYSRIFSQSNSVQNMIVMPHDWKLRWPKFHQHVTKYMAAGKNAQDDAVDCLTGMVEFHGVDNPAPQNLAGFF